MDDFIVEFMKKYIITNHRIHSLEIIIYDLYVYIDTTVTNYEGWSSLKHLEDVIISYK